MTLDLLHFKVTDLNYSDCYSIVDTASLTVLGGGEEKKQIGMKQCICCIFYSAQNTQSCGNTQG